MPEAIPSFEQKQLEKLLAGTAKGDKRALEILYGKTHAKLFGVCLRICGNDQVAQELLQETYVKIWRRADSYATGRASPMSWLITIARNSAIDWRRAQPQMAQVSDDILLSMKDEHADTAQKAELNSELSDMRHCLRLLDKRYTPVIRAAYLDGLSHAELAAASGKPIGTVKSWIRRGLAQLKECIDRRRGGQAR